MKRDGDNSRIAFLSGKGKDFSRAANEIHGQFSDWLGMSCLTEEQFDCLMKKDIYDIVSEPVNGGIRVCLAKNSFVLGSPFLWLKESGVSQEAFYIDLIALLLYISARRDDRAFDDKVRAFYQTLKNNGDLG